MRVGMGLEKVRAYLEDNKPRHVARIQRAVQQASVSSEDLGVVECADLLAEIHREAGFQEAEVVATDGLPGLWAAYDAGAPKTIIVYNNFDTRPVLPNEKWEHPPYSGALTSAGPYGQVVMGRGAMSKGGYVAWLNALEALLAVEGTLPVNVLTLLEGDEILGSPNFRGMYAKYRDRLATATASLSPGANQDAAGRVSLTLGYKGMIYAELVASGARWGRGPQSAPLHGMTASVVDSPAWRLVHALASLMEPGGNRIAVPGYYDDVTPPTEEERRAAFPSPGPWNKVLPGVAAAPVPLGDLGDEETVMNFFYGPSLNINALRSGFTGPGTLPFSLPHEASALFDIRVPRGYKVQEAIRRIREHLDAQGYQDLDFNAMGAYDPSTTDPNSELVRSVRRAFQEMDVPVVSVPGSGGGGPWSIYATDLGLPVIRSVGLGGGAGGGANEYLVIDGTETVGGLVECELSHIHLLKAYAEES